MSKPPEVGPNGKPIWGRNDKGVPVCNAKRHGNRGLCKATLLLPNGRCRLHGGLSGGPIIHGRRSKALAGLRLAEKFEAVLNDEELVSHRNNIRTLEVLALKKLEDATPPEQLWQQAVELYEEATSGSDRSVAAMIDLGDVLKKGLKAEGLINDAVRLLDQQRKHIVAENRREAELDTTMTARQANAFIMNIIATLSEELTDHDQRNRVAARVLRLSAPGVLPRLSG